ncbi:MAG: putative replicase [Circoviridae sp.]|nr:MAG: putative replicase [Circoviridae sp.]
MSDKQDTKKTECTHYVIRLDRSSTTTSESIALFLSRQDASIKSYILSKEGNGQTIKYHYHLYIEFYEITKKDTVDKRFKRNFENRGTTSSIAICKDSEKARTYTVKDGDIVQTKGFTKEQLKDYSDRSYQKTKKPDMFNILLAKCKKNNITTEMEIMELVFNAYKGNRMYYSHMKAVVKGLNAVLNPKDEFEHFINYCQ